jgi:hypothetical protein
MANTIELDGLNNENNELPVLELVSKEKDCDKVASEVWWAWWGNGFSAETADLKKAQAKKDCEDEKKVEKKKRELSADFKF